MINCQILYRCVKCKSVYINQSIFIANSKKIQMNFLWEFESQLSIVGSNSQLPRQIVSFDNAIVLEQVNYQNQTNTVLSNLSQNYSHEQMIFNQQISGQDQVAKEHLIASNALNKSRRRWEVEQLRKLCQIYIQYINKHPQHYWLIFAQQKEKKPDGFHRMVAAKMNQAFKPIQFKNKIKAKEQNLSKMAKKKKITLYLFMIKQLQQVQHSDQLSKNILEERKACCEKISQLQKIRKQGFQKFTLMLPMLNEFQNQMNKMV